MLKNYLKILFRNFLRNKSTSLINTFGLGIGLSCCLLIGLYISDELSFDRFHPNEGRIYQVITNASYDGQTFQWNGASNTIAPSALNEIPEIEKAARILYHNFDGQAFLSTDEIKSMEERFIWADQQLLEIFSFEFVQGNPAGALALTNKVIISEAASKKYFGDLDNVLGKILRVNNKIDLEVSGVFKNQPANSRFQSSVIGSFASQHFSKEENLDWSNASFETYFLLHESASKEAVELKVEEMINRNVPQEERWYTLQLKPLSELHLYMGNIQDIGKGIAGDINQVKTLLVLAFIVLLIAVVNYVNLSTAQSQKRFKEVGINKTLGASRRHLMKQFFFETFIYAFVAILLAIQLTLLVLPLFNSLTGKLITEAFLFMPEFLAIVALGLFLLSVLAGFYPAFYLSGFSPKQILKISTAAAGGSSTLRKGLVVAQFSLSIILIICTIILYQQLSFVRDKNLGFKPDQVVTILTTGAENTSQVNSLRTEIEKIPGVKITARSQAYPGTGASGRSLQKSPESESTLGVQTVRATAEIIEALSINLLAGKTLPAIKNADDTTVQIILNRTAIEYLGFNPNDAIGQHVKDLFQYPVEIVGVVEDFHFGSLHSKIGAYCFHNAKTEGYNYLLVQLETSDIKSLLSEIRNTFSKIIPTDFQYSFVDQRLETLYAQDKRLANVVFIFSALAIFIACLGLYALASFTTEQRTKEIGIRKVLGASITQVTKMLSIDFVKLVFISVLIAAPIGYFTMEKWLSGFAYRIEISFLVFAAAGIISVVIAFLTISYESIKAAQANPVESLRSE